MKIKVCVVTGTRAEYHLLYPLLNRLKEDSTFSLSLAVTGSHLSEKYGNTYKDIEADGFSIDKKVFILKENDTVNEINQAIADAIVKFGAYFIESQPDLVVVLGDRYELLAVSIAAMNSNIPIVHLHGGETTEGAIDEYIRHAITKMSYLHFASCEAYRKRIIQLGEHPSRVYNVGAIGLENIKNQVLLNQKELEESLEFELKESFALITFHPVTLEPNMAKAQFGELLQALSTFENLQVIFTKANADSGGLEINRMIDQYVELNADKCISVYSLGMKRYLSAMSLASIVIGNSSSGIIESPSFCVPTVNIGNRQKGRIQAKNIINCEANALQIENAIKKGLSHDFVDNIKDTVNPYGDGCVSEKIVTTIKQWFSDQNIDLCKSFYDIDFKEIQES